MRHLSHADVVDLLEGRTTPSLEAHRERCASCRARVEELRAVLEAVRDDEIPEPSPLFWDHFSERLRDRIEREPQPTGPRGLLFGDVARTRPRWMRSILAAATVAVLVAVAWTGSQLVRERSEMASDARSTVALGLGEPVDLDALDLATGQPDESAEWTLLLAAADGLTWEAASSAGLSVAPGDVDEALEELTVDERRRLGELLEAEIGPSQS